MVKMFSPIKGSVKFSLSITGASKCMPQKFIEADTQELYTNVKWQICYRMCIIDELCVSFNYWVIETCQKEKNFTRSCIFWFEFQANRWGVGCYILRNKIIEKREWLSGDRSCSVPTVPSM